MMRTYCGRCHTCGARLRRVLDGEEWCPTCEQYRRYRSHGWSHWCAEPGGESCPEEGDYATDRETTHFAPVGAEDQAGD